MKGTVWVLFLVTWWTCAVVGWVGGMTCPEITDTVPYDCKCIGGREDEGVILCNNTNLQSVPSDLPLVSSMHFEGNNISNLEAVPYPSLTENLILNNNNIETISPEAFQNLTNLKSLSLNDNHINNINSDTFTGLVSLETLSMKNSDLKKLEERTFVGRYLEKLRSIELNNCNLTVINKNAFIDMHFLLNLNLAGNHLQGSLYFIKSQNMPQLKFLNLSQCSLQGLEGGPFSDLHSLKHLDLRNNQLSTLSKDSFSGLINIQTLQLDGNLINTIGPGTFSGLGKLEDLGLSFNQLASMEAEELPSSELHAVSLHHNPWKCDCAINWMRHNQPVLIYNLNTTFKCAAPAEVVNEDFFHLSTAGWNCDQDENSFHGHQTAAVVLGLLAALAGSVLLSLLLYRFIIRRRLSRRTIATISGSTSGYRRVNEQGLGMS